MVLLPGDTGFDALLRAGLVLPAKKKEPEMSAKCAAKLESESGKELLRKLRLSGGTSLSLHVRDQAHPENL
jgi:hypothetical protein